VLIGNWINEGRTIGTAQIPPVPILTSERGPDTLRKAA
jgi:hypothetical protein